MGASPKGQVVVDLSQALNDIFIALIKRIILLTPLGVGSLVASSIADARDTALSKALGFLVRDFEPAFFWWELIELSKKLFLVGFAVLIKPGSIEQLVMAFLVSLSYMLLVAVARPFKATSDDVFATACCFALTAFLMFCVILKVSAPCTPHRHSMSMSMSMSTPSCPCCPCLMRLARALQLGVLAEEVKDVLTARLLERFTP